MTDAWSVLWVIAVGLSASAAWFVAQRAYQNYQRQVQQQKTGSPLLDDVRYVRQPSSELPSPARLPGPSRVLLLGPACAGKSTIMRHAVAMSEGSTRLSDSYVADEHGGPDISPESPSQAAREYKPTLGLVRNVLTLPSPTQGLISVLLCDAGGGQQQRRQWIELVRGAEVSALVFVVDAADDSEESLGLFRQLANAPWAQRATVFLALSKVDLLGMDNPLLEWRALAACEQREADYRAVCRVPLHQCHILVATRADSVEALLAEVAEAVASR